jgi:hypothetical protein
MPVLLQNLNRDGVRPKLVPIQSSLGLLTSERGRRRGGRFFRGCASRI